MADLWRDLAAVAVAPRDDDWLVGHLDAVWRQYFPDVPIVNPVEIAWRRPWKQRLGLITLCQPSGVTFIGLNSLLAHPAVPTVLTTVTVAHELVHYSHGFGSPLPRLYRHPHQGGIVDRDLARRGLGAMLYEYQRWIDAHWYDFHASQSSHPAATPRGRRTNRPTGMTLSLGRSSETATLGRLPGRAAEAG